MTDDERAAVSDAGGADARGAPLTGEPRQVGHPGPEAAAGPATEPKKEHKGSFLRELPILIIVAILLALLIKSFLIQAFFIPSGSMERTLLIGDRVLVNKIVYRVRDIHRGDIVVFNGLNSFTAEVSVPPPANGAQRVLRSAASAFGVGQPGEKDFIKRVIAVPGDTVACCTDGHVTVSTKGGPARVLNEPYLYQDDPQKFGPVSVPAGRLWVMGDHRSMSADSRSHVGEPGNGTVPADKVIGRAFVIVWPPSRGSVLHPKDPARAAALGGTGSDGATTSTAAMLVAPYALGLAGALPLVGVGRLVRRRRGSWRNGRRA
ncbi:MAG: signal peptidase I [Actinomycetota bacterium]|nr:signal peptidase I [Actinomycetota bacterium]